MTFEEAQRLLFTDQRVRELQLGLTHHGLLRERVFIAGQNQRSGSVKPARNGSDGSTPCGSTPVIHAWPAIVGTMADRPPAMHSRAPGASCRRSRSPCAPTSPQRLLGEVLARERTALEHLAASGHADLLERYQDAIGNLEILLQQDPQNASMKRMITDAHFNLGATALQEERMADAMKEFDEVLKRDPTDELATRSKLLAERYNGQPKDLLYKIYVKYLPLRRSSES